MEEQAILDNNSFDRGDIGISENTKQYLQEAAKWARFLAILGFVLIGFIVILAIFFIIGIGSLAESFNNMGGMGVSFVGGLYLIFAAIFTYPIYRLYMFAKNGLDFTTFNDPEKLEISIKNLRSFFRFYGIFSIIYIAMFVLGMLVSAFSLIS